MLEDAFHLKPVVSIRRAKRVHKKRSWDVVQHTTHRKLSFSPAGTLLEPLTLEFAGNPSVHAIRLIIFLCAAVLIFPVVLGLFGEDDHSGKGVFLDPRYSWRLRTLCCIYAAYICWELAMFDRSKTRAALKAHHVGAVVTCTLILQFEYVPRESFSISS